MSILRSVRKNGKGVAIMLAASFFVAVGQYCWKVSGSHFSMWLLGGFVLYGVGALLMTLSLRYGELSVVHPCLCCSYVFATLIGTVFLDEALTAARSLGILLIMAGVVCISGGGGK